MALTKVKRQKRFRAGERAGRLDHARSWAPSPADGGAGLFAAGVVRGAGGKYRVLKNKLAARASQGTEIEAALQGLKGVSSVAYTCGDPVALAKALTPG